MTKEEILKTAKESNEFFWDLDEIVTAFEKYRDQNKNIYINFNGQKLYSLIDDRDSCYKKVTGKSYTDFKESQKKRHEEYLLKEKKAKEEAIAKMPERFERGLNLIYPQRKDEWKLCVEARTNDLYHGSDLDNAIDVMESIEKGATFDQAYKIIEDAGHSGMSFGMTLSIISTFSKKGVEFYRFVKTEKEKTTISEKNEISLQTISQENEQFQKELDIENN